MDNKEKTKLGNDVIKKWTNIKDNFFKYTKKVELSKKSGAGAKRIKEYHLYRQLMFLQKNAPNLTEDSIEEESQTPNTRSRYQPYRKTTLKRKPSCDEFEKQIVETLAASENRHLSFFKAILPSLNKLNDHQTLLFQSGVLKILTDFHQSPFQSYSGYQTATSYDANYNQTAQQPQATMSYETNYQTACNSSNPISINRRETSPVSTLEDIMSNTTDTLESEYDFS
ncbi:uncharacterized protein LOC132902966 [Amyelois transitella]|nr:uncharacterized protein LOC132902966 [Amyelois transitella]